MPPVSNRMFDRITEYSELEQEKRRHSMAPKPMIHKFRGIQSDASN
jgi:hypothetical protein